MRKKICIQLHLFENTNSSTKASLHCRLYSIVVSGLVGLVDTADMRVDTETSVLHKTWYIAVKKQDRQVFIHKVQYHGAHYKLCEFSQTHNLLVFCAYILSIALLISFSSHC